MKPNKNELYIMKTLERLGITVPDGYFFNDFNAFQKVNNEIYVYVTPCFDNDWKVQAYFRRNAFFCALEARISLFSSNEEEVLSKQQTIDRYSKNIVRMFELGEMWLKKYGDNAKAMEEDMYAPGPNWKGNDITNKELYQD
ncbi:hypothetical protein [Priestia aryabhattai]